MPKEVTTHKSDPCCVGVRVLPQDAQGKRFQICCSLGEEYKLPPGARGTSSYKSLVLDFQDGDPTYVGYNGYPDSALLAVVAAHLDEVLAKSPGSRTKGMAAGHVKCALKYLAAKENAPKVPDFETAAAAEGVPPSVAESVQPAPMPQPSAPATPPAPAYPPVFPDAAPQSAAPDAPVADGGEVAPDF